jgi:hypothetical protein
MEDRIKDAKRFIAENVTSPADRTPEEQAIISKTICIDFDDTLFIGLWQPDNPTHEIGPPIWENINKAKKLVEDGWYIVILTARGWEDEAALAQACKDVGLDVLRVECGKPIAVGYIDDRAVHESEAEWGTRRRITDRDIHP